MLKDGKRSGMDIAIYTSVWGKRAAAASAILHAPSGREQVRSATAKEKADATMLAFKEIIVKGVDGNGLAISIMTNDSDLYEKINKTWGVLRNEENLPNRAEWEAIVNHLQAHNCKLVLAEFQETEITERATATAQFMLRQAKTAYNAAKAAEKTSEEVAS